MANPVGRPPDLRRAAYAERFDLGLASTSIDKLLTSRFMDQLDRCKTDEARRILLGVSK